MAGPVQLSRRRFGALAMGGCAYLLVDGVFSRASARSLPEGVMPVASPEYGDGLPRSTPEAQGVRSEDLLAFLDEVERAGLELHSFMLMRNGHVIAEAWWWPYGADRVHMTHSLTKSVTATAVGLAIDEGRFGLDDKVAGFFPEYVPRNASDHLRAMTVRDLLTMRTGHDRETSGSVWRPIKTSWVAEFFKIPVVHAPGTHFQYTSAASYMLSAIVSKTTGQSMAEYLKPRFFAPLGIDRWRWDTSPGGISPGGNGLSWNTAASLKLGAVHAQRRNVEWTSRCSLKSGCVPRRPSRPTATRTARTAINGGWGRAARTSRSACSRKWRLCFPSTIRRSLSSPRSRAATSSSPFSGSISPLRWDPRRFRRAWPPDSCESAVHAFACCCR